jgi:hypothetical protein
MTSPNEHPEVSRLRRLGKGLLGFGVLLACGLMFCLFAVGYWLIVDAIWTNRSAWLGFAAPATAGGSSVGDSRQVTIGVLHGLEVFFLAPLPALVFLSVADYFKYFHASDKGTNDRGHESASLQTLHRVEGLVVNLMIASIATDLVGKVLQGVSLGSVAAEASVVLLLGLYWVALELVSSSKARRDHSE